MAAATKDETQQQQFLTFFLADEEYAISILRVKEIIGYDIVTSVPKMPGWIRGVINLRGNVVPVVDLAARFGLPARPVSKTTCIIIVDWQKESQNPTMGVIADAVSQVMDITGGEILAAPSFGTRVKVDYLQGMVQMGKKFGLLLDIERVLSGEDTAELRKASTELKQPESNGEHIDCREPLVSETNPGGTDAENDSIGG